MALSTVTLKWSIPDLIQSGLSGTLSIVPTAQLADVTDHELIPAVARTVTFSGGTGQLAGIVANDNANILPAGTGYLITVVASNGQVIVPQFQTQILTANGATQWLDQLAIVPVVTTAFQYLPLPSGTAAAGAVPAATGAGEASAWTQLTALGVGAAPLGAGATAAVPVSTTAETVVASVTMPAGMAAGASYRVTAWGSTSIGGTGGTFVSKVRVGGLAGAQVASASSGAFSANGTGFWVIDAIVTLQAPGASGTWSGFDRQQESVSGTNSSSAGAGTATASSLTPEVLAVTVALSSSTSSASCLGSTAERIA